MAIQKPKNKLIHKRKREWPYVYSRTQRSGQVSYVVDLGLVNNKRERYSFKTKSEANVFAQLKRTERGNQGAKAILLPTSTREDAIKAESLIKAHGVTLVEAAQYYLDHVIAYRIAPILSKIVDMMVASAKKNNRRERTVVDLKNRLNKFADDFPNTRLSEITVEEIKDSNRK